jgi:hypothetical protein
MRTNANATTLHSSIQESNIHAPPAAPRRAGFRLFSSRQSREGTEAAEHKRPKHSLCIILGFFLQMLLLRTADTSPADSVAILVFAVLALVVPFGWYVWGFRDAPMGLKTSRGAVQWAVRVLAAMGLSLGGFVFGLASLGSPLPM